MQPPFLHSADYGGRCLHCVMATVHWKELIVAVLVLVARPFYGWLQSTIVEGKTRDESSISVCALFFVSFAYTHTKKMFVILHAQLISFIDVTFFLSLIK